MKQNIKPLALLTIKEGDRIEGTLFKARQRVVPVKLAALLKTSFVYLTFSSKFLRTQSFEVLWVASCERLQRPLYQRLTKNLMMFAGANRIVALKEFRQNPSQIFYKTGVLQSLPVTIYSLFVTFQSLLVTTYSLRVLFYSLLVTTGIEICNEGKSIIQI